MTEQCVCRYCKNNGTVVRVDNLFYARCARCNKWSPYKFLGNNRENAIESWNESNKPKEKKENKCYSI